MQFSYMKNEKEINWKDVEETYVSVDIETDGPIPGENSMLSLGVAAFDSEGELFRTFEVNLLPLANARPNRGTMEWWATQPEAWNALMIDRVEPFAAMRNFHVWLCTFEKPVVFVGYPAGFDFTFVYWYLMKFCGHSPFSFSAIDIKTYAMAMLKTNFKGTTKKNMPAEWFGERKHTHKAIDDAREQGELFMRMLKANKGV